MAEAFLSENLPENLFGAPKAGPGMWASCIRVLDPSEGNTLQQINLEQNEAAVRSVHRCLWFIVYVQLFYAFDGCHFFNYKVCLNE